MTFVNEPWQENESYASLRHYVCQRRRVGGAHTPALYACAQLMLVGSERAGGKRRELRVNGKRVRRHVANKRGELAHTLVVEPVAVLHHVAHVAHAKRVANWRAGTALAQPRKQRALDKRNTPPLDRHRRTWHTATHAPSCLTAAVQHVHVANPRFNGAARHKHRHSRRRARVQLQRKRYTERTCDCHHRKEECSLTWRPCACCCHSQLECAHHACPIIGVCHKRVGAFEQRTSGAQTQHRLCFATNCRCRNRFKRTGALVHDLVVWWRSDRRRPCIFESGEIAASNKVPSQAEEQTTYPITIINSILCSITKDPDAMPSSSIFGSVSLDSTRSINGCKIARTRAVTQHGTKISEKRNFFLNDFCSNAIVLVGSLAVLAADARAQQIEWRPHKTNSVVIHRTTIHWFLTNVHTLIMTR